MLLLLITGVCFGWLRGKTLPFAERPTRTGDTELSTAPEKLPWFASLGAGPLLILGMTALYLHQHWQSIPARFPIHWGANGAPNRWAEGSIHGVYGPLLFGAEFCSWMLLTALASWFGARRSRLRRSVLGTMIATEYLLGFLFSGIAVNPLIHIPMWIFLFGPLLFLLGMLLLMARRVSGCNEAAEATPNECWHGGLFYFILQTPL